MGHLRFVILFDRNNQHEKSGKDMFYCITFLNFLNSEQEGAQKMNSMNKILSDRVGYHDV